MEKQIITFSANEQKLQKTSGIDCYASNTVAYIEARFDLGDNWSGYDSVRAVWFTDFVGGISTVLDSLGTCIVPYEVLARKSAVKVNLVGSIAENDVLTDRLTTCPVVALTIKCNAKTDGDNAQPITPSQFEQFVANVKADADRAESAKDTAVNAVEGFEDTVVDATDTAVQAVQGAGTTQIAAVQAEGSTQVTAVQDKGNEVIESIPADYTQLNQDVTDVKSDINEILESSVIAYDTLEPYLYKKNTYINSSGVDTTLSGYDTYKIPLNDFDVLHISWDAEFWTGLSTSYIANVEFSDSSRLAIFNLNNLSYAYFVTAYSEGIVLGAIPDLSDVKALYFTVKNNLVNNVHIAINKPYVQYVYDAKKIIELDSGNSIQSGIYYGDLGFSTFSSPYFTNWVKLNNGDRIDINKTVTGVNGKAMVIDSSGNISRLTTDSYIATDISILCIFNNSNISGDITFTPSLNTEIVDDGKPLKFIAGVIRNSGDGWEYINDSGHEPLNLTSISVDSSGRIVIDYGFTASKVLSLVATPDETFAGLYSIGGSVGLDKTLFNVYALPKIYGGMVRVTSGVFDATSYASFSSVAVQVNGEIRLYHPSLSGLSAKEIFNIQASSPSYAIKLGSQGYDYVSLYVYDSNGQKITDFTGLSFDIYATRNVNARFVNANNIVDAGGNFWIYGVMEI